MVKNPQFLIDPIIERPQSESSTALTNFYSASPKMVNPKLFKHIFLNPESHLNL